MKHKQQETLARLSASMPRDEVARYAHRLPILTFFSTEDNR